jgi:hypothetical protein
MTSPRPARIGLRRDRRTVSVAEQASPAPGPVFSEGARSASPGLSWAISFYIAVVVGRLHESIPFLARFYLGKAAAAVLLLALLLEGRKLPFQRALTQRTAICWFVITALAILSIPGSVWPGGGLEFLQGQWPLMLLLLVAVAVGFSNIDIATLGITTLTVTAGFGAIQLLTGSGLSSGGRAYIGGSSTTYDSNYSATFFVMALPYAIMFAARPGKLRWPMAALVPALTAALITTGSRGGVVALVAVVLSFLAFSDRRFRKRNAMFLLVGVAVMLLLPKTQLMDRFHELTSGSDYNFESRDGRLAIWRRGLGMMFQHPVLGVGIKAYEMANGLSSGSWMNAHNALVQIGAELGVLGLLAFVVSIASSLRQGLRLRTACSGSTDPLALQTNQLAAASVTSLVSVVVASLFLSMAFDAMMLFAVAVPSALALSLATDLTAGGSRWAGSGQPRRIQRMPVRPRPT